MPYPPVQQDDEDVVHYGDLSESIKQYGPPPTLQPAPAPPPDQSSGVPGVNAPYTAPGFVPGASQTPDWVIGNAAGQLSAGQPVTALPKQDWSYQQQQAAVARLDQYDQQAKAAAQARDQAARDARMYDQMMRVARSTKDIEIARRSIDVMGLQNDIARGVPIHEAVSRHPMALGSSYGGAVKATAPVVPPAVVTDPVTKERAWVSGEHVTRIPAELTAMGTPQSADVDGTKMVQLAPNRWQQVREPASGKLTDQQKSRISSLGKERDALQKEMSGFSWEAKKKAGGAFEKEVADKEGRLQTVNQQIEQLQGGAAVAPVVTAPAKRAVKNPTTGKWELQ